MTLESLKSPGLTQAQFALPAMGFKGKDPSPGTPVSRGCSGQGVAVALHLMDKNHLSCCILSFVEVQYFQMPPKKPDQQTEQIISTAFNYA